MARRKTMGGPAGRGRGKPGGKKRKSRFREQAKCRFCRDKVDEIDYKDIGVLSKMITQHGKMFSRKRSGNCASCQRKVKHAVKRARFVALLPYVS